MNRYDVLILYFFPPSCTQILMTPRLRQLVMGENQREEKPMDLIVQLYKSLVEVLVQSVESTTRDLREILRLLRIIWPFYLKPLLNNKDNKTGKDLLDQCYSNDGESNYAALSGHVSEVLGSNVRPYIRRMLNECLLRPGQTMQEQQVQNQNKEKSIHVVSFAESLPYYSKFLLLAAYLCQSNKADLDRKLYTNTSSGRRSRRKKGNNDSFVEMITHASSTKAQQRLRSERIPSFPLERLLSIFSSITGKYATSGTTTKVSVDNLGSISLFASLAELRELGYLTCTNANSSANTNRTMIAPLTKYICNLSKNEAILLSSQVKFPISNYLAENI